jgi:hydrogenase expression/formation protein HypC
VSTERQLPLHNGPQQPPVTDPISQPASSPSPELPECHDGVCTTCSDEAVEVTVVALLDDDIARVDTEEGVEEISVALVDAAVGDRVLVHAKEAIGVVR